MQGPVSVWREGRLYVERLAPGTEVVLGVRLVLGSLEKEWVEGPLLADDQGMVAWAPVLDRGAALHELAADYVTDLLVDVVVTTDGDRVHDLAPPAVVAWPEGLDAPARIWDRTTAAQEAPRGVIDPNLRAALPPGAGRVRAPIPYTVRPEVETTTQEDDR